MNVIELSMPCLHMSISLSSTKHLSHKKHLLKLKGKTNQQKGNLMLQRAKPHAAFTLKFGQVRDVDMMNNCHRADLPPYYPFCPCSEILLQ